LAFLAGSARVGRQNKLQRDTRVAGGGKPRQGRDGRRPGCGGKGRVDPRHAGAVRQVCAGSNPFPGVVKLRQGFSMMRPYPRRFATSCSLPNAFYAAMHVVLTSSSYVDGVRANILVCMGPGSMRRNAALTVLGADSGTSASDLCMV
jgi:hypothetical protein